MAAIDGKGCARADWEMPAPRPTYIWSTGLPGGEQTIIHRSQAPAPFGRNLEFHPLGRGQVGEYEAMRLLASRATTLLSPAGLGVLAPLLIGGGDRLGQLHVRSDPPPGFGGAEFRFTRPFRAGGGLRTTLDELMRAADDFVAARQSIATLASQAAEEAKRLLDPSGNEPRPPRLLTVGADMSGGLHLSLDVETLGQDLRLGQMVIPATVGTLPSALPPIVQRHRKRDAVKQRLDRIGASCIIDGATLSILAAIGGDPVDVAARMHDRNAIGFTFAGPDGVLYDGSYRWGDGSILTTLVGCRHLIRFDGDELTLFETKLPATTVSALEGRPLSALIEIPWLPEEAVIKNVTESGDWIYVRISCPAYVLTADGVIPFDAN